MAQVVTYTVMGREHQAERGASLLAELRKHGYVVPSLCHHPSVTPYGACRLCLVEVKKGKRQKLTTSCNYPVQQGIEVLLDTPKVKRNRKMVLELLLAQAPAASPPLHQLAKRNGVGAVRFPSKEGESCILCGLCVRLCASAIGAEALTFSGRGDQKGLGTPYADPSACVGCGSCAEVCPTDAVPVERGLGTIRIWERNFTLERCKECGAFTLPSEQIDLLVSRTRLTRDYFELCDECRRRATAARFDTVMGR
jgi:NADH dehydrogenase/NADH:ubiquinone oxidoreductase subunit G